MAPRPTQRRRLALAVRTLTAGFLCAALSAAQSLACTFHPTGAGSLFEPTYPGSLKVAAATAQARSEGRLPRIPLERGLFGYARVAGSMMDLGTRLGSVREAALVDFSVVLAAQQLWTQYKVMERTGETAYGVRVHAPGPLDDRPAVVTSYDVVAALFDGSLTADEAVDDGLLQVRDDEGGHVTALFRQAFPVNHAAGSW